MSGKIFLSISHTLYVLKVIAAILLLVFSSFTIEKSLIPSFCMSSHASCKMKCSKGTCCKMGKMKENPMKKNKEKPLAPCTDCPLCVVILDNHSSYAFTSFPIANKFYQLQVKDLSDQSYQQWKPPNR